MPDEVRARYGGTVAAPRTRRPARRGTAPAEDAAPATDVDEVQEQPEAAAATAAEAPAAELATDEPDATVAEVETEELGNPPETACTEDRPEEGHGGLGAGHQPVRVVGDQ